MASERVMTNCEPVEAPAGRVYVIPHVVPAVTAYAVPDTVQVAEVTASPLVVLPPKVIEALSTLVFAVPVLLRVTTQFPDVTVHVAVAVTCAVDVNDPNRPNTKPAMAMAAMRVMAMSMTVAMTGEMAFLPWL